MRLSNSHHSRFPIPALSFSLSISTPSFYALYLMVSVPSHPCLGTLHLTARLCACVTRELVVSIAHASGHAPSVTPEIHSPLLPLSPSTPCPLTARAAIPFHAPSFSVAPHLATHLATPTVPLSVSHRSQTRSPIIRPNQHAHDL